MILTLSKVLFLRYSWNSRDNSNVVYFWRKFDFYMNGERISGAHLAILLCQPVPVKKVENVINNDQLIAL